MNMRMDAKTVGDLREYEVAAKDMTKIALAGGRVGLSICPKLLKTCENRYDIAAKSVSSLLEKAEAFLNNKASNSFVAGPVIKDADTPSSPRM